MNNFPPHVYWDGRCFPTHLTSFGSSNNSSSSPSTLLGFENNFDQEESLLHDPNANDFEEVQDDEPIGYTPQLSAVWNNDDLDWEDNTAQIEETFDNLLLGKVRKQKDETVTIQKKEIKSNTNHSFDMVILFQKFSYYYLSIENDCGEDRFANVEESDLFLIHLPSETIRASKKLLASKSNFFKLMIESEMKEANENQVDFSSVSNEEGLDTLKIVNYIRYGNAGVPIKGTAFPLNLEDYGSNLIGIVDLLRLLDVADKFGVASFVWAVTDILNQYNVMILLEKALHISPELGSILIDACISVISENLPCVMGGLVYEGVVDQFLEVIPSNTDEWGTKCREIYKIFKKDQTLDGKTENLFVLLQTLKSNPTVNYLVDVLPRDIFIQVMKSTTHFEADEFAGIFTLWIFSSSFETCFQDYDTLENLETDNFIYRLLEGVTIVLNSVNVHTLNFHRSVFILLLPIITYYSRSYPSDFQSLLSRYVIDTSGYIIESCYLGSNEISNHLVAPMLRECFKNHQKLPENDMVELYSHAFIDPSDNSFIMENAQRIIPHLFSSMLKESDMVKEITRLMSYVLINEFKELVDKESTKDVFQNTRIKELIEQNGLKTYSANLFGLDASGKTLILERLKAPNSIKMVQTIQTIGFNNEAISYAGVPINVVDVGGSVKIRGLWKNFISPNIPDLIVMVVDLSDQQRFQEAREAFDKLMSNVNTQYYYGEKNNQLSILLLANKTDCIQDKELRSSLQSELFQIFETSPYLDPSNNHRFKFMPCSAKTGEGIEEIWTWFLEEEFIGKYSTMDTRYFIPLPTTSEWRTAHY